MFGEPENLALRMIWRSAKIYKHIYGEYPETVGLDLFSRFREWQQTPYVDTYHFRDVDPSWPQAYAHADLTVLTIPYTNVAVKVEPVTFSPVRYNSLGFNPRPTDREAGLNEVWCKRGEHEVRMHLLFTESGYHTAIVEKSEIQPEQGA